ncbi:MAG: hypothetical protein AAF593_05015 [Planctomycetota bacterium]
MLFRHASSRHAARRFLTSGLRSTFAGLFLSAVFLVGGCQTTSNSSPPMNTAPVSAAEYPTAFEVSGAVLRDEGFGVDRQDFRFGKITSRPKGSPTLVEAWQPDNTYPDQALRSTLGDLRRTITVTFTPTPGSDPGTDQTTSVNSGNTPVRGSGGPSAYDVRVEVLVERLQVPERRMNGSTRGVVFADLAEVPEELQARGIAGRYWQPVGRDLHLEQRLLQDILGRTRDAAG